MQPPKSSTQQGPAERKPPRGFRKIFSRDTPDQRVAAPKPSSLDVRYAPLAPTDVALLYPQLSPYDTGRVSPGSTYSAPDELEFHHVRHTYTSPPPRLAPPRTAEPYIPMNVPRSPTYPPAGRGRMSSFAGISDAAFADAEEFHLFVQATAGLGPVQFSRSDSPSSSPTRRPQSERVPQFHYQPPVERDVISPLSETPTTQQALYQLAQMPEASVIPQPLSWGSVSGFGDSRSSSSQPEISPLEDFEDDDAPPDDELPNYAESQAQAQHRQRAEAARRARELQTRWQASGARRGI